MQRLVNFVHSHVASVSKMNTFGYFGLKRLMFISKTGQCPREVLALAPRSPFLKGVNYSQYKGGINSQMAGGKCGINSH